MSPSAIHSVDADGVGWIVFGENAGDGGNAVSAALASLAAVPVRAVILLRAGGTAVDDLRRQNVRSSAAAFAALRDRLQARPLPLQAAPLAVLALADPADGGLPLENVRRDLLAAAAWRETSIAAQAVAAWFPAVTTSPLPAKPCRIVGIVGATRAGAQLAQWCTMRGMGVILSDRDNAPLRAGMEAVRALFREATKRGWTTSAAAHRAIGGMAISTDWEDLVDCDLVIETVAENAGDKRRALAEAARVVSSDCLLATTAVVPPVEEICPAEADPARLLGLRFFDPMGDVPLVEIALGTQTDRAAAERALAFVRSLEKPPLFCRSSPAGCTARVLGFLLNEACRLREEGVPVDAIDGALEAWGWPLRPLRRVDEMGIDACAALGAGLAERFPGRFSPAAICRRMADAGLLGRAGGAGFYAYSEAGPVPNPAMAEFAPVAGRMPAVGAIADRLLGVVRDEARRCVDEGVVKTPNDAALALALGAGFPTHLDGPSSRPARDAGVPPVEG